MYNKHICTQTPSSPSPCVQSRRPLPLWSSNSLSYLSLSLSLLTPTTTTSLVRTSQFSHPPSSLHAHSFVISPLLSLHWFPAGKSPRLTLQHDATTQNATRHHLISGRRTKKEAREGGDGVELDPFAKETRCHVPGIRRYDWSRGLRHGAVLPRWLKQAPQAATTPVPPLLLQV